MRKWREAGRTATMALAAALLFCTGCSRQEEEEPRGVLLRYIEAARTGNEKMWLACFHPQGGEWTKALKAMLSLVHAQVALKAAIGEVNGAGGWDAFMKCSEGRFSPYAGAMSLEDEEWTEHVELAADGQTAKCKMPGGFRLLLMRMDGRWYIDCVQTHSGAHPGRVAMFQDYYRRVLDQLSVQVREKRLDPCAAYHCFKTLHNVETLKELGDAMDAAYGDD